MLILNGNSLELSYGWVTLRKEAPYRHLSTSSPVLNPYVTWSRGLRCVFSKGGQNGPRRLGRWGWDLLTSFRCFFLSIYLFFWHCVVIDLYTIILKGWFIKNLSITCMFVLRWLLFTQNMKIQQKYNYLIFFYISEKSCWKCETQQPIPGILTPILFYFFFLLISFKLLYTS